MTPRAYAVVLACILTTVLAPQFAAQKSPTVPQVYVANPVSHPVPTAIQGTAAISGSVNVTNTSLPVNGSVAVSNLPLDSKGNVLVSMAANSTQYQFQNVVAFQCNDDSTYDYLNDFCTQVKGQLPVPVEQTLAALGAQGYQVISIVPLLNVMGYPGMLYALQAPVTAGRKRNSRF